MLFSIPFLFSSYSPPLPSLFHPPFSPLPPPYLHPSYFPLTPLLRLSFFPTASSSFSSSVTPSSFSFYLSLLFLLRPSFIPSYSPLFFFLVVLGLLLFSPLLLLNGPHPAPPLSLTSSSFSSSLYFPSFSLSHLLSCLLHLLHRFFLLLFIFLLLIPSPHTRR